MVHPPAKLSMGVERLPGTGKEACRFIAESELTYRLKIKKNCNISLTSKYERAVFDPST